DRGFSSNTSCPFGHEFSLTVQHLITVKPLSLEFLRGAGVSPPSRDANSGHRLDLSQFDHLPSLNCPQCLCTETSDALQLSELQQGRYMTLAMEFPKSCTPLQDPPYSIFPESGSEVTLESLSHRRMSKPYSCVTQKGYTPSKLLPTRMVSEQNSCGLNIGKWNVETQTSGSETLSEPRDTAGNTGVSHAVVVYAFKPSTRELEAGGSPSSRPAWSTEQDPGQAPKLHRTNKQTNQKSAILFCSDLAMKHPPCSHTEDLCVKSSFAR
ncbi:hypothetical protein STEG23_029133, partial [Scotinomys teguina]